jgi:hypothetical protein
VGPKTFSAYDPSPQSIQTRETDGDVPSSAAMARCPCSRPSVGALGRSGHKSAVAKLSKDAVRPVAGLGYEFRWLHWHGRGILEAAIISSSLGVDLSLSLPSKPPSIALLISCPGWKT